MLILVLPYCVYYEVQRRSIHNIPGDKSSYRRSMELSCRSSHRPILGFFVHVAVLLIRHRKFWPIASPIREKLRTYCTCNHCTRRARRHAQCLDSPRARDQTKPEYGHGRIVLIHYTPRSIGFGSNRGSLVRPWG